MTQPSFEYLEDKKVLRQVPPPEPKPSSEYPDAMRSSDDWARWHDDHLKWVELCASLPTYPVITPTEQWEREVRGRKDLKEGVEFSIEWAVKTESYQGNNISVFKAYKEAEKKYLEWSKYDGHLQSFAYPPSAVAIPIIPVQEEVKGGDEGFTPAQEIIMEVHIKKLKERGAVEAEIILTKMVHANEKLYEQILDSNLSYYFNELCKKAIAYDALKVAQKES